MSYIVTHTSPDFDAIGFVFLLRRFVSSDFPVKYVNTGNPDPDILEGAWAVGDTGPINDPTNRRFNHHVLSGNESIGTCATMQVYEWLVQELLTFELAAIRPLIELLTFELAAIRPLIELIFCGDTGSPLAGADTSRKVGIHALLMAQKAKLKTDDELMEYGCQILNDLADVAINRARSAEMLSRCVTYKSKDGLVVAIEGGSYGVTAAAFEDGARLVFFSNENNGSFARGVQRNSEYNQPHVGELVDLVSVSTPHIDMIGELMQWYLHPAGFFAGRGTAKAPCTTPMEKGLTIANIAAEVDHMWRR